MYPIFAFQETKSIIAFNLNSNCFNSSNIAFLKDQFLGLEPLLLSIHQIHTHQHACPITALGTTGTRCNLQHRAQLIFLAAQHILEFKLLYPILTFTVGRLDIALLKLAFLIEF